MNAVEQIKATGRVSRGMYNIELLVTFDKSVNLASAAD